MEQFKESPAFEGQDDTIQEMIDAKGKEADLASKEVDRMEDEIRKLAENLETPNDASARAQLEAMLPQYKAALAEERRLEDEWIELLEKDHQK